MKSLALLLAPFLFICTLEAEAADNPIFCAKLSDLQKKVQNCEQNDYYAEAAVLCLQSFEARAKATSSALNLNTSANAQNQALQRTQSEIDKGKTALGLLVAEGAVRLKEIQAYSKNINLPEDADNPTIVGGDIRKFLKGSQCYKRAAAVLESTMEEMQKNIKNLQAAKIALGTVSKEVGSRNQGLDSGANPALPAKAANSKVPAAAARKSGKSDLSDSKVTGIEESQRKSQLPPPAPAKK